MHAAVPARTPESGAPGGLRVDGALPHAAAPGAEDVEAVVARARTGDEAAWRELVRLYGRRVFGLVKARVGSVEVAEEVTQSVFATVAAAVRDGRYDGRGRFEPWLFRVATNRARDEMRRRRHRALPMGGAEELEGRGAARLGGSGDGSGEAEGSEGAMRSLRAAVAGLGEADREVIELRHHGGLGFKEIAAMLGEPMGTVLARHHRALAKLRAMLEKSAGGGDGPSERASERASKGKGGA